MVRLKAQDVRHEMQKCDDIGLGEYLKLGGFGTPKRYWVRDPNRPAALYPAKAIAGYAAGKRNSDFSGGVAGANEWLDAAGFEIVTMRGETIPGSGSKNTARTQSETTPPRLDETELEAISRRRVGQDKFRKKLIEYWQSKCAVTGIPDNGLLRASHIIPWSNCESGSDRLDVYNGLLLSPFWDAAFDRGLVSFSDSGEVIFNSKLSTEARKELERGVVKDLELDSRHLKNLAWHRREVFGK